MYRRFDLLFVTSAMQIRPAQRLPCLFCLSFALTNLTVHWIAAQEPNTAQETSEAAAPAAESIGPLVCKVQMQLVVDGDVVDVIEKGDLLTVEKIRNDAYVVRTFNGRKGVVSKANAVPVAQAADVYTELIEAAPENGRLYTLRAGAFWEHGDKVEALADFDRAIELGYKQPHAYVSRGLFKSSIGQYDEALDDYAIAIKEEPQDVSHRVNRAAVFMLQNKFEQAIEDYDAAIKADPKNSSLYQQRAIAYKASGKLKRSSEDFSKAIELEPNNISAIMGRGFVYFQLSEHKMAVENFSQVIQLNPKAAVALNNRGYNLQQIGEDAKALADYNAAIEIAPEYGLAHQNRAWLLLTGDKSLRDASAAMKSAETACKLSEFKNPGDLAALAAAHAYEKEFDKAVGLQEKVVEMVTSDQQDFARAVLNLYIAKKPYDAKAALDLAAK